MLCVSLFGNIVAIDYFVHSSTLKGPGSKFDFRVVATYFTLYHMSSFRFYPGLGISRMPNYENCPNLCFVNQSFNNLVCNNENEHYKYI